MTEERGLPRQLASFGMIGGGVLAADWAIFVVLSASGVPLAPANGVARVGGAALSFVLNGRHTFPGGTLPGRWRLARFVGVWLALTGVSTVAVAWLGLHAAWVAKPFVDAALAGVGFLASRYWIYR